MNRRLPIIAAGLLFPAAAFANNGDPLSFFTTEQDESPAAVVAPAAEPVSTTAPPTTAPRNTAGLGNATADVIKLADELGVPRALALAVCRVESRCQYGLTGPGGVHGPLQIKHPTARGLGFNGPAQALKGYQGAVFGMKHLAVAYRKCGSAAGAAKLHQAGLRASCGSSAYSAKVARLM